MRLRLVYISDSSKPAPSRKETYDFGVLNEGLAIGVAKNVKIRPNEFTLPARTVVDISGTNSQFQDIDAVQNWGTSTVAPVDPNSI
jgi:hypothetical protein